METKFQTTFIPKRPMTPSTPFASRVYLAPNLFFVVAVTMAVCVALAYGGTFLYVQYLRSQVTELSKTLSDRVSQIDKGKISELTVVGHKLDIGNAVLSAHIAPSLLFNILELFTITNVQFKDFSFDSSGKLTMTLNGEASSYSMLAAQSDVVSKNPNLKNVMFSDFNLTKSGTVLFKMVANIDPSAVSAERVFENLPQLQVVPSSNSDGGSTTTPTGS